MKPPRDDKPRSSGLGRAGMLLAVPSLLIVAPLLGFFVGRALDGRFHTTPWLSFVGLVLGFAAAGREIAVIIRRVQSEEEGD